MKECTCNEERQCERCKKLERVLAVLLPKGLDRQQVDALDQLCGMLFARTRKMKMPQRKWRSIIRFYPTAGYLADLVAPTAVARGR